jgi:hypothetical protein
MTAAEPNEKSNLPNKNEILPRKISLYGVGITSPGAANLREFLSLIQEGKPALSPIEELQGAFLVGQPKFDFAAYRDWITERHAPNKFSQLSDKGYSHVRMAVGTSIDALESSIRVSLFATGAASATSKLISRVTTNTQRPIAFGRNFGRTLSVIRHLRNTLLVKQMSLTCLNLLQPSRSILLKELQHGTAGMPTGAKNLMA